MLPIFVATKDNSANIDTVIFYDMTYFKSFLCCSAFLAKTLHLQVSCLHGFFGYSELLGSLWVPK